MHSKPLHNSAYWVGRSVRFGVLRTAESPETNTPIHSRKRERPFQSHANTPSPPKFGYRYRHEPSSSSAGNRNCHSPTPRFPSQPTYRESTGPIHVRYGVFSATDPPPIHIQITLQIHAHVGKICTPPTTCYMTAPFSRSDAPRCSAPPTVTPNLPPSSRSQQTGSGFEHSYERPGSATQRISATMQNLHMYGRTKFLTRVHLSLTLVPSNQELINNGWDDGVEQFWRNFLFFA